MAKKKKKKETKKKEEDLEEDFDEDWFEDDEDWEEEKPKKKSKKEKNYAWVWVAAFIVILAILLLVRYRFAAPSPDENLTAEEEELLVPEEEEETVYVPESEREETDQGQEEEGYVYEPPRDAGADVVTDEEIQTGEYKQPSLMGEPTNQDIEHARDLTEEPELFSNIRCEYDYDAGIPYIKLRVYNVLDEDILISPKGVAKGYNTYFMIRGIVDKDPGCGTEVLHPGQYTECKKIGFDGERYANVPGTNRISVEVPGKTEALIVNCPEPPEELSEEEE